MRRLTGAWLLMLGVVSLPAQGGETSLPQVDATQDRPNPSVFVSDPAFGKDPFFPASQRRVLQPTTQTVVVTNVPLDVSVDELFNLLEIKGISFPSTGPLVLVNRYTLAEGEERNFKMDGRAFRVRCVTIKDRSAVLSIRGRTKELSLRSGL